MRTVDEILKGGVSEEMLNIIGATDPAFWIENVIGLNIEPFHREWFDLYTKNDKVILIAPTGHGKSELFGVAIPIWYAWFNRNKEILIVSNTDEQAKKIIERIVACIADNEMLKKLLPEKMSDVTWTKKEINTTTKVKMFSRPYNDNLRGYHVNLCICDEGSQYKDHSTFERYVFTRVTAKGGKLVMITTPKNAVDLPDKYLEKYEHDIKEGIKPTFIVKKYTALVDGVPIFPERVDHFGNKIGYSIDKLNEIKDTMGSIRFEQEYMCNVMALEDSLFPPEMVMDCMDDNLNFEQIIDGKKIYIGVDLAFGTGKDADFTVFTVIESVGGKYYIRHIERHKGMLISVQANRLDELNRIYKPKNIFVDQSNFGTGMVQDLRSKQLNVTGCPFDFASRNRYLLNLRKVIEDKMLVIPRGTSSLDLTDKLYLELTSFVPVKMPSGIVSYKATTKHDDMVMSLALSLCGIKMVASLGNKLLFTPTN